MTRNRFKVLEDHDDDPTEKCDEEIPWEDVVSCLAESSKRDRGALIIVTVQILKKTSRSYGRRGSVTNLYQLYLPTISLQTRGAEKVQLKIKAASQK